MTADPWTKIEDDILSQLWREGLTAGQIVQNMPHRSRNSVIARARRLKLPARPSPIPTPKPKDSDHE